MKLKYKAKFGISQVRKPFVFGVVYLLILKEYLPFRWLVQKPQYVKKGTFARARGTDYGDKLSLINLQVYAL
jgi:hypothetical protein